MFQPGTDSDLGIEINFSQAEDAMRKFKSHRRVGMQIMMDIGILDNTA